MRSGVLLCVRVFRRLLSAMALGGALVAISAAHGQSSPNVVVIVTDDQGIEAIAGANWPNDLNCRTPNLAALASRGRVFINARSCPVCSPTRASMLSGRSTFRTGVVGVLWEETAQPDSNRLALQTHEKTIAEVLKDRGYFTMLSDKWHVGWDKNAGLMPDRQGFDVYLDYHDSIDRDRSDEVGDEHMSYIIDQTVDRILRRSNPNQPYALFFWSIDPHQRVDDREKDPMKWWRVSNSLLPSGENYYADDTNRNRYRAVVEALDTELARMLRQLGVINASNQYIESSNTVVFFTSDNGSPPAASVDPVHAKSTVYERGTRVPMFVFGENVPADGAFDTRLTMPEDFFETIADVVGATPTQRGTLPRTSFSFADAIGYSTNTLPRRPYAFATQSHEDVPTLARTGVTDGTWKLIVRAGGANLAPLSGDEFYDLRTDPTERQNLVALGMNSAQRVEYLRLRDAVTDAWPTAIGAKTEKQIDVPITNILSLNSANQRSTTTMTQGHLNPGRTGASESRIFIRFNTDRIDQLLPPGKTINDVTGAQVLVAFRNDTLPGSDSGAITLRAMTTNWWTGTPSWTSLLSAFDGSTTLGFADLAPNIVPNPAGSQQMGMPMPTGTPVSFGHSADLLTLVRQWHDSPTSNNGVVLIAAPLTDLTGDQRITFLANAGLRLTFN